MQTAERRAARLGDLVGLRGEFAHRGLRHGGAHRDTAAIAVVAGLSREGQHRIDRALADRGAVEVDAGQPGLRRERDEVRTHRRHLAPADVVLLLRQHDDRATFRRLVRQRRKLRRVGQLLRGDPGKRDELGRLAIAERDGAGLVQQQRIDVSRGLHCAAGHRQHVEAHQAVHAGDADRRQQRADRGGDQCDEQRDQDHHRHRSAGVAGEARDGGDRDHEDDRQAGEQNVQRDLVRRLLTLRAFHQRDHAVEEGGTLGRGNAHLDPVGQHARAAGDGRPIAAALADHRGGFTGDRRFIDRGDAFDHLAVARDHFAGLHQHEVPRLEVGRGDRLIEAMRVESAVGTRQQPLRHRLGARPTQRRRLRLAAAFRHRLGEVGEQHGHPQPEDDLGGEAEVFAASHQQLPQEDHGGEDRDNLDHEHHRVLDHQPRIKLDERLSDRRQKDRRIQNGGL